MKAILCCGLPPIDITIDDNLCLFREGNKYLNIDEREIKEITMSCDELADLAYRLEKKTLKKIAGFELDKEILSMRREIALALINTGIIKNDIGATAASIVADITKKY